MVRHFVVIAERDEFAETQNVCRWAA